MSDGEKVVATNKKAFHDYQIFDRYEAGIVLSGPEVKSLREGRVNLKDSYAIVRQAEIYLLNCHISPYSHGNRENMDPTRTRKLLLHRQEINKLIGRTVEKGFTLVPLRVYFKGGRAKAEIALVKGKKLYFLFPPNSQADQVFGPNFHFPAHPKDVNILRDIDRAGGVVLEVTEGDTVFIPAGWWHTVLNITDTIA